MRSLALITSHEQLSAVDLESHQPYRVAVATSALVKNNDTVLESIPGLSISLDANKSYLINGILVCDASGAAGLKIGFTVPALAVGAWASAVNVGSQGDMSTAITSSIGYGGLNAFRGFVFQGYVINGANAGTLQVQAAQNVATVEDTTFNDQCQLAGYESQ